MNTVKEKANSDSGIATFGDLASRSLGELRTAMTKLFADVPGGIRKSYDVNKLLGVDARLSWQIFKLVGPGDALALVPHVPGRTTMQRLLAAATRYGISPDRIAGVRGAFDAFEDLVERHAGDRSMVDTMTRGLTDDESSEQSDVQHRKWIFQGHRHYMAVEIDTTIQTIINYETPAEGVVDVGTLRTKLGMRRLRADGDLIIDQPKMWQTVDDAKPFSTFDPNASGGNGLGILSDYCSNPLPKLDVRVDRDGQLVTSLAEDKMGRQGEVNLVFGNVWRNVPFIAPDDTGIPGFGCHFNISIPTTQMYVDVMVPKSMAEKLDAMLEVFGQAPINGNAGEIRRKNPRLLFREKVVRLSGGVEGAQLREMPNYLQMIKAFLDQLNWRADEMAMFRLNLKYPIVGSLVSLRFNLRDSKTTPAQRPAVASR